MMMHDFAKIVEKPYLIPFTKIIRLIRLSNRYLRITRLDER